MADTPKPMQGTWTLTAPDGRTWQAETPLRCVGAEQRERVPPEVALQRIMDAADEPTDGERDLAALCARLVRRLRDVAPEDKLAATATDYLSRKRYLNPLRIKPVSGVPPIVEMTSENKDLRSMPPYSWINELADIAYRLEDAANSSDKAAARRHLDDLLKHVRGVPGTPAHPASDPNWLREKLAMTDDSMVGGPPPTECWMIERGPNQGQLPHVWWSRTLKGWTEDPRRGTRFPTKEVAEQAAGEDYVTHYAVTGHSFIDGVSVPPASASAGAPHRSRP